MSAPALEAEARACRARIHARLGRLQAARSRLATLLPWAALGLFGWRCVRSLRRGWRAFAVDGLLSLLTRGSPP